MSEFENKNIPELPRPSIDELVDLTHRGEISPERFEFEADWIAMQESAERYEQRKAARREKIAYILGRLTLWRNKEK